MATCRGCRDPKLKFMDYKTLPNFRNCVNCGAFSSSSNATYAIRPAKGKPVFTPENEMDVVLFGILKR